MYILAVCNLGQKFLGVSIGSIKLDKMINTENQQNVKCLINTKNQYLTLYKATLKSLVTGLPAPVKAFVHSIVRTSVPTCALLVA